MWNKLFSIPQGMRNKPFLLAVPQNSPNISDRLSLEQIKHFSLGFAIHCAAYETEGLTVLLFTKLLWGLEFFVTTKEKKGIWPLSLLTPHIEVKILLKSHLNF
jgi:hypothetical protein